MTSITVPKGHKGFKNDISFNLETKKLVVITGVNGSGKTTLLSYLYRERKKSSPNSVFFKTTGLAISHDTRRRFGATRYRDNVAYRESLSVEMVCDEIYEKFFRYCAKHSIYVNNKFEVFNMLFSTESDLYEKGYNFLYEISEIISQLTSEPISTVRQKLGSPTEQKIKKEIYDKLKAYVPESVARRGSHHTYKEMKDDYDSNSKSFRDEHVMKFVGLDARIKSAEQSTIGDLEKKLRSKSRIKNRPDFENYIYELINPFQTIEEIVDKLSKRIDEDFKKNKAKRKASYWQLVNEELQKYHTGDEFNYFLNPPTDHNNYEISFYSKDKTSASEYIHFKSLSSGEKVIFELICYYFVCCKDENSKDNTKLMILDEFDANLNPSLAELYLKVIRTEFINNGIKVILTTHSPSTVAEVEPDELCEIVVNNSGQQKIKWAENEEGKKIILDKLAPNFVYDDELGFFGLLKGKEDIVVFVEGRNDEKTLKKYAQNNEFNRYKFIECGSADNIFFAIRSFSVIPYFARLLQTKTIIGLFDFDKKGYDIINKICSDPRKIIKLTDNKKAVIMPKKSDITQKELFIMALIPPVDFENWNNFEKIEGTNSYRREEMIKEAGQIGIKRQFDAFEYISKQNTSPDHSSNFGNS